MDKIDLLECRKQTLNFDFYCTKNDELCLNEISRLLEYNYNRVQHHLNISLEGRVEVKIYPDTKTFHKNIGKDMVCPEWLIGAVKCGVIHIVSPLNPGSAHRYESVFKIAVHELIHVIIKKINPRGVWRFLDEGFALFWAEQFEFKHRNILVGMVLNGRVPAIGSLESDFIGQNGFVVSYSIVEFIINQFGFIKLKELIVSPSDFEKTLNITKHEFERRWTDFLNEHYRTYIS